MPNHPTDILDAAVGFPETVYIVGSAPEKDYIYNAIPQGAFVIVLNGAIEAPLPVTPAIWLMGDPKVVGRGYWNRNIPLIRNSGYDINPESIRAGGPTIPVIEHENIWPHAKWVRAVYTIKKGGIEQGGPFKKSDGYFRIGATIAGVAVQMAAFMGAKYIRLIGIRMEGDEYFDGSKHDDPGRKNAEWPHKRAWDWMLNVFNTNGLSIRHVRDDVCSRFDKEPNPEHTRITTHNLFEQFEKLPNEVVILGSGPNGADAYDKIKPDDYVICVNGSIGIVKENIKPRMWILADGETPSMKYFVSGCERSNREQIKRVWSHAVKDRAGNRSPHYVFPMVHQHDHTGFYHVPDRVRPDATVVGIAMDICYRYGVKHVRLCGVDMSGDKYYDGSDSPGNCDDDHGEVWQMRDALDSEIAWMHRHGMRVSTLSATKLREPHADHANGLPSVALMTMAHNPVYTKHAIFNAAIQDYPDHLKTLYLITQNGEQPPVATDLPFRIVQLDVDGAWPELWMLKYMEFITTATEDYIAVFDEDDYFEPDYISRAVDAITDNDADMSWTFANRNITRYEIRNTQYRSAFGTLIVRRDLAEKAGRVTWWRCYDRKYPDRGDYGNRGAQDMNLQHNLIQIIEGVEVKHNSEFAFGDKIVKHEGRRWYCYHLNANTCSGRLDEECIDYWMPGLWYTDTRFEKVRSDLRKRDYTPGGCKNG